MEKSERRKEDRNFHSFTVMIQHYNHNDVNRITQASQNI